VNRSAAQHTPAVALAEVRYCPADAPPRTIRAAEAEMPALAQQQGVGGQVTVKVTIDAEGKLIFKAVSSSASALLNSAALTAAAQSTFAPAIRDCHPVGGTYDFIVDFNGKARQNSAMAAYMGVVFDDSTGAVIVNPVAEGPADMAGLENGDVLLLIDGERVSSADQAIRRITAFQPGTVVDITVMRDAVEHDFKVTLLAHP
jgi:TonB family protein